MKLIKFTAAAAAVMCLLACASCGKKDENVSISVDENQSGSSAEKIEEGSVGELITPEEGSEEYDLGSYRKSSSGVKLYYEDEIPTELVLALEKYFTCFQDRDFDTYRSVLYPDYAARYSEYLEREYEYDLATSFELNCKGLRKNMVYEITGEYESEDPEYTGDFTITRIRVEPPELTEDETLDDLKTEFFGYLDEIFDMDYYSYVSEDSDAVDYVTFYIIAEGEDEEEHRIISGFDIVFAEKDGNYYTFG